jgi:hypothetical protein
MVLTLFQLGRAFFGQGSTGYFLWEDRAFVSGP